jgi:D-alanyl-D-alanine carboxypeptidase
MNHLQSRLCALFVSLLLLPCSDVGSAVAQDRADPVSVPSDIKAIMDRPFYKGAIWGLRVVDIKTGQELINLRPDHQFLIASVRKVFTTGELMNQIGPDHTFNTPIYRHGSLSDKGILHGDLILVASGDLTMGGRTKADGTVAFTAFDHNEADGLGNAILTKPDPLAGYAELARQVAASGIKEVTGEVVIDDRLFQPYDFRDQFKLKPVFVNDDVVDLILRPRNAGALASLVHRPLSDALQVDNAVEMKPAGGEANIEPGLPTCIGQPDCTVILRGVLPVGFVPPLTERYPLIRTFRIVDPSSYARTVLIEELRAAGVKVKAPTVELNPTHMLPAHCCYEPKMRVAQLQGLPYSEDAKLINKVSYNLGADTSMLLYGLTQGVDTMKLALAAEKINLQTNYGINPSEYVFVDGSGSGDTSALTRAVTHMLVDMYARPSFPQYVASFPILGVDGSLETTTDFESDLSLALARGRVHAKPGTYIGDSPAGPQIKALSLAGYVDTNSGRKLAYTLIVNNVPFKAIEDAIQVFQDEGTISAILWRDN